jgi:hypothetical protein
MKRLGIMFAISAFAFADMPRTHRACWSDVIDPLRSQAELKSRIAAVLCYLSVGSAGGPGQ